MDKIVQDMFYLNSSYSKEVVLRRFSECLEDFGIIDFGIITRATNHCTTLDFTDSETIEYTFLYDKGAEILHMYHNDANGAVVHEVYRHETEAGN